MTRLKNVPVNEATGSVQSLFDAVKKNLGIVPNLFQGMAVSPAALKAYLTAGGALEEGALSFAERETVALAVSQINECQYCLAAHTALGKMAGISEEETIALRKPGRSSSKLQALSNFVRGVVQKKGYVSDEELSQVKKAGYSEAALTESIMVIALTFFTNFFNHVNQTVVDFPSAPSL